MTTAKSGSGTYVYDLATGETRFVTAGTVESWIDDRSHPRELTDAMPEPGPRQAGTSFLDAKASLRRLG